MDLAEPLPDPAVHLPLLSTHKELSRHVSHSQSYSTDWAEVRWAGGGGVERAAEEGRSHETAKIGELASQGGGGAGADVRK